MPLTAYVLCKALNLPTDIAIGVILVGCCPGGTASNVITYIAKGDVALSVGMTIASTLLAPLLTPFLIYSLGGTWVEVSFLAMVMSVVKVVLIPVLVGIAIHHFFGKKLEALLATMPLVSSIAIVMIIAGIISVNVTKIFTAGYWCWRLLFCIILSACALVLRRLKCCVFPILRKRLLPLKWACRTAASPCRSPPLHFAMNPLATLPGAIFSVWHNISGAIFASIRQKHDGTEALVSSNVVKSAE